jgi:hypothetical protein
VSDALKSWPRCLRALPTPVGIVCASVLLHGCSLLYDLSTTQCTANADCSSFGEGLVCGAEHFCQIDTSGCGTHAECLDDPDNFGLSACIKDPAKTRGVCTPLTTPECPMLLPLDTTLAERALRDGEPVILGAFTNTSSLGPLVLNYDLVVNEFQNGNGGISTSGGTRPVLVVTCSGTASGQETVAFQAGLDQAMDHLIALRVPGVVSGLEVADLKRVFEQKGKAAKMFFMSSGESDNSLGSSLQDNGLVWEVLSGGTGLARAYKPLVDRTISYLQGKGAVSGAVRVALVSAPDISLLGDMGNALQSAPSDGGIVFNDKSVFDNIGDTNFFGTTTPSIIADEDADLSTKVDELLAFKPHIIVSTGASEFLSKIVPSLEQQWDSRTGGQARPFYILSPYQYNRTTQMNFVLTASPTVQQRLIGLNAPAALDPTIYDSYIARYTTAYPGATGYQGKENLYDSAYYLLYAASAASPALTDGASIATGMGQLLQGSSYKVGPGDMNNAIGALRDGRAISLVGAGGPPNFNIATGGKDDAGSVWCVDSTRTQRSDVLRYQVSDGTMQGTFPCFADF